VRVSRKVFYGTLTVAPPDDALLEGAHFVESSRTAPRYRLFSLEGFPTLVEDASRGRSIEVQIWEVPDDRWARILESEPADMVPGTVELEDGRRVETLLGTPEFVAARNGVDVSEHGSWKAYREASG
jgi:hypothetical protein